MIDGKIHWDTLVKDSTQQWKYIFDWREVDVPEGFNITRIITVIKWSEAFSDLIHTVIGVRTTPLEYVTIETVRVFETPPPLENNRLNSKYHGSVEGEWVARAMNDHTIFRYEKYKV